jgi:hypothetical protein
MRHVRHRKELRALAAGMALMPRYPTGTALVEFCCSVCLFSVMAADDGPWPRCPRCRIKLTPDCDLPPARPPDGRARRRRADRPVHQSGGKAGGV